MIKGTEDTRYAFVNGIVRAKEARLLTRSHFDRLVAGDLSSFDTILSDTTYVGHTDIITGFDAVEEEVEQFFKRFCLHPEVQKFIDWPQQIHNLKVKLKQGGDNLMYAQETSEVEAWPEIVEEVERFAADKDPFVLSTAIDKILCMYFYQTTKCMPFFYDYFQLYFDLENIRSFFRARQFANAREIFTQVFIDYGTLTKKIFLDNLDSQHDVLGKNFFTTPYATIMDKGSQYLEQHHSFLRLERICDEMKLEFLLQARKMTFGIEPLFTYYQFRISEIRKLRQAYWGKLNKVSVDDLKESIPDVW